MSARPIYRSSRIFDGRPADANAGLWYDKFCNQWNPIPDHPPEKKWGITEPSAHDKDGGKLRWIRTVTGQLTQTENIEAAYIRLAALASAIQGNVRVFTTAGRFVTGLGRSHPIENGFAWHPTLGAPYLPGSSVKGLVKAWAREEMSGEELDVRSQADFKRIFGGDESGRLSIGSVLFFDAIPCSSVKLEADVMTPHYGPYYADAKGTTEPGDWHDPNPIPFLAVATGQPFLFALAPNGAEHSDDCARCLCWLEEALKSLGAGAKTAIGYGRFLRNEEMERRLAAREFEAREKADRDARLATLSPQAHAFETAAADGNWEKNKDAFARQGVIEGWIEKLEASPHSDVLARLGELIENHFPGLLANPQRTEGKKNKPSFKPRQQEFARRFNALQKAAS